MITCYNKGIFMIEVLFVFSCKFTLKDYFIIIMNYICTLNFKTFTQMASRKKLKSTIKFVSSELITDIYFRCLMSKSIDNQKVDSLVVDIMATCTEFVLRVNRPDGKNNSKLVKAYFRKLFSDWQLAMDKTIKEIENL